MAASTISSFRQLLQSFLQLVGHNPSAAASADGFEFVFGDFVALVGLHPSHEDRILIEVHLNGLPLDNYPDHGDALLMLHNFNNTHDHEWAASIDENDLIIMSLNLPLITTDAVCLQTELADGLHRAQELQNKWNDISLEITKSTDQTHEDGSAPNPFEMV